MLATTPAMGWNAWNTFGPNISDTLLREIADTMIDTGLAEAGYRYIVIDDCWSSMERDENGRLVPDKEKFPNGLKPVIDYIHQRGLKFGLYSSNGNMTCCGYPAAYDHEFIDAQTYADWGVDFLKLDNCYKPKDIPGRVIYNRMGMALKASGREILFSACNWGDENVHTWARSVGAHQFRSTNDINDCYKGLCAPALCQMESHFESPGCFNDLDMLVSGMYGKGHVAVTGCTDGEYLLHHALWCFFQSPLMIGCDIRNMSEATKSTLMNRELLRLDQDKEARPPFLISHQDGKYSYLRHLENGEYAIAYFNFDDEDAVVPADFADFGLHESTGYSFDLRDIISGEKLENVKGRLDPTVEAHSFRIYRGRIRPAD